MRNELLPVLSGLNLDESACLTLGDLCQACAVHAEWVIGLVEEGVLEPSGGDPAHWRFPGTSLRRLEVALRLHQDLELNLAGVALALELMDQIEQLRGRLRVLDGGRS
jgi:chaperone modulatory protein CbpM